MFPKPNFEWTKEEELAVWDKFKKENSIEARDQIFAKYIQLVDYIAGKMKSILPPIIEFDDLVGYGCMGLWDAVTKFDYTVGAPFNVYAKERIYGAIHDELRKLDMVPRSVRDKFKKIEQLKKEYLEKYDKKITEEEISQLMGIKISEVKRILQLPNNSTITSIDRKVNNKDGSSVNLSDLIPSSDAVLPEEILHKKQVQKFIGEEIMQLPEIQQKILVLCYKKNLTLKEAGRVLEMTESRVCQIRNEAIEMIRNKVEESKNNFF